MFSGTANWEQLTALKQLVRIPVIGSGDLFTAEDCQRMLAETGCDGVMVARGALGNPWIFRQALELLDGRPVGAVTVVERADMAARHLSLFCAEVGEAVAVREMKKHFGWYIHGVNGASLLRREVNGAHTRQELETVLARLRAAGVEMNRAC